jgi:hypothetical protein
LIVDVPAPSIFAPIAISSCGQVGHFGLAGAVLEDGLALGQHRRHQHVFRAGDGDLVEDDVRALQAIGRASR